MKRPIRLAIRGRCNATAVVVIDLAAVFPSMGIAAKSLPHGGWQAWPPWVRGRAIFAAGCSSPSRGSAAGASDGNVPCRRATAPTGTMTATALTSATAPRMLRQAAPVPAGRHSRWLSQIARALAITAKLPADILQPLDAAILGFTRGLNRVPTKEQGHEQQPKQDAAEQER